MHQRAAPAVSHALAGPGTNCSLGLCSQDAAEAEGAETAGDLMGGRVRHAACSAERRGGRFKGILVDKTLLNNYLGCCAAQRIKLIDSVQCFANYCIK